MAQHPNAGTPMLKKTYRVYGTAEGQIKFPARSKSRRADDTQPPLPSSASESNLATAVTTATRQSERPSSARWSRSSSPTPSEFSN